MLQKNFFGFLTKKQPKLTKNEENWQNPNRLMTFSEIWYVDASQQKKCYKKTCFEFRPFWPFFNQKQPKKERKKNCQNPNRSMKFSENWYVDASHQKKCY